MTRVRKALAVKSEYQPSRAEQAFMARRLGPLLTDDIGRYSIQHLLSEAYLQGLRDAAEIAGMKEKSE